VLDNGYKTGTDILSTIVTANRAHSAYDTLPSPQLLSRNTKLNIYKTLTKPILRYWAEASTIVSEEMNAVRAFERKTVGRKKYGPKQIRIKPENKNTPGDTGYMTRGRHCTICKIA